MMLFDRVTTSGVRITKDGYLVADARVARTGVQAYLAGELDMPGDPMRVVKVYRPAEEVFSADAMASYAHRPVTNDHPAMQVDASNWKEFAKGQTGGDVLRDGEYVRVPVMLMDGDSIKAMQNGKRELSMGYTMTLDATAGTTPDGEAYEAVQRDLRMNHLALVSQARGGSELKLGDNQSEETDMKLQTITVDGLSVETTDAGAQAISKLTTDLAAARISLKDSEAEYKKALALKDAELATKDATIDDLKGKQLTDADLDARVTERADLVATAKRVADLDYKGMPAADIRSAAVAAKLGKEAIDGKSADYINARFDILAEDCEGGNVRRALRSQDSSQQTTDSATAHQAMVENMQNAWQHKPNGGTA